MASPQRLLKGAGSVLAGICASFLLTIFGLLIGAPLALTAIPYLTPTLGLLAIPAAFALLPLFFNLLVGIEFLKDSEKALRYTFLVSGVVLSVIGSLLLFAGFFFSILADV